MVRKYYTRHLFIAVKAFALIHKAIWQDFHKQKFSKESIEQNKQCILKHLEKFLNNEYPSLTESQIERAFEITKEFGMKDHFYAIKKTLNFSNQTFSARRKRII